MFVIERGGVTWDQRFYSGRSSMTPQPQFGPLTHAYKFESHSRAVSMSYRIDDEAGCYTTVEKLEDFSE
jgi:hypothetical protein